MRRLLATFMASLMALVVIVPTAFAAAPCGGRPGIVFYKDTGFRDVTMTWCVAAGVKSNVDVDSFPGGWNDQASSYRLYGMPKVAGHPYWSVRIYSDTNQGGSYFLTSSNNATVSDMGVYWQSVWPDGFNDKASSIRFYYND